jgi:hypothetical protein
MPAKSDKQTAARKSREQREKRFSENDAGTTSVNIGTTLRNRLSRARLRPLRKKLKKERRKEETRFSKKRKRKRKKAEAPLLLCEW